MIDQLELRARIGISAEERAEPQRLTVSLVLFPRTAVAELEDRIENAVDYKRVCDAVVALAEGSDCQLLETLAERIAVLTLRDFALTAVEVELRKFILSETNFVAVKLRYEAQTA